LIRTDLCDMLGMEYPIMQAAMGPYDTMDLAIAVTNAGGFGNVSHPSPSEDRLMDLLAGQNLEAVFNSVKEKMADALNKVKSEADGHFGLNLRVAPEQPEVPGLLDMIIEMRESDAELKEKLVLVITSAGNPKQPHLRKIKEAGMKWFHNVPSVYHARKAEEAGVDALVATGYEAGGHVTFFPVHTMVLVPEVISKVDIPVVAGGGICDGKGLVAALAFGAIGVYMGTRFIATRESEFSGKSKETIVSAAERFGKENATLVTQGFFGPLRHLRNKFSEELEEMKQGGASEIDLLKYELKGSQLAFGPAEDVENGALWCGQVAIRLDDIPAASEVIQGIMSEAEATLEQLQSRYL
jgi:NAD(P)H-dependent flavin oxidoreductase YrpB (nitropropane dioxygenase family)